MDAEAGLACFVACFWRLRTELLLGLMAMDVERMLDVMRRKSGQGFAVVLRCSLAFGGGGKGLPRSGACQKHAVPVSRDVNYVYHRALCCRFQGDPRAQAGFLPSSVAGYRPLFFA